ncbi:hypothetical protein J5N97_001071 [Dioscorea zingiberensis]|uniref:C-CAP/cofactor C-like domain-containing protein n=1 Tax=Dioscorea zingiberensis TaxID=325984 RepID=A0A9D5BUD2_9LILI|nr:hypothetical protein J5N97_001071 [Dioscorea zingiberensis]
MPLYWETNSSTQTAWCASPASVLELAIGARRRSDMEGSGPNPLASETWEKKQALMIERLENLHQARKSGSGSETAPSFESVALFLSRFSDSKHSIDAELARLRALDPTAKPDAKPQLEALSDMIADLERLVAENSYFLPSYEIRSSLKSISDLKESLDALSAELVPRKKFAFKNKPLKKAQPVLSKEKEEIRVLDEEKSDLGIFRESPGFRNQKGTVLVKQFRASEEGKGDFSLVDLDSCEVYLKGKFRALFVHRIKNCRIFVGPVLGSVLIEDVEGCLFMLASHQIRIHQAKVTDFYLRLRSRPIIEDCSVVRFAPYKLVYEGIEEELQESGLAEETENWANVDDFRWLRAMQSPNWCVLPEEEQIGVVDISDKKGQCQDS